MPNVYVTVCDDLRIEITGKLVIVGMYVGDLLAPSEGTAMPQVHLLFGMDGPLSEKPNEIEIEVTFPGGEPRIERPQMVEVPFIEGRTQWQLRHSVAFMNQPLIAGKIRAIIRLDGEEHVPSTPWIMIAQPLPDPQNQATEPSA